MRLAAIGDIHLTDRPCKSDVGLAEQVKILTAIAEEVERQGPDATLLGGDLYDRSSSTDDERVALWNWLARVARVAPVVAISGNPTHESRKDIEQLNYLRGVTAVTRSELVPLGGRRVGCAPWPQAKVENGEALYADVVRGLRAKGADLLLLHADMVAAKLDGGQDSTGKVSSALVVDDFGDTPTILYHYHKRQQLGADAWYGGAIRQMRFGDDEHKGFGIYDTESKQWEWFGPYGRRLREVSAIYQPQTDTVVTNNDLPDPRDGDLVRVRYQVSEADRERARAAIDNVVVARKMFGEARVALEPQVIADTRTRGAEVAEAKTEREKLIAFWGEKQPARADKILEKMEGLG